jgi:HlyD family secretion protein
MRNRKLIWIGMAGILALTALRCSRGDRDTIRAAGVVDGEIISMKAPVGGKLIRFNAQDGMAVSRQDTLAVIDTAKVSNLLCELSLKNRALEIKEARLKQRYRLLEVRSRYFSDQVQRYQRLSKEDAVSEDNLETMRLSHLEVETNLNDVKRELEALQVEKEQLVNQTAYQRLVFLDHIIQSPVNGVVLETYASEGETVFPPAVLADLLDLSSLIIEVFLEEEELGRLVLNQKVRIQADGRDEPCTGYVASFGRKAEFSPKYIVSEKERRSLLYRVQVRVDAKDAPVLKVGMPVTVCFPEQDEEK